MKISRRWLFEGEAHKSFVGLWSIERIFKNLRRALFRDNKINFTHTLHLVLTMYFRNYRLCVCCLHSIEYFKPNEFLKNFQTFLPSGVHRARCSETPNHKKRANAPKFIFIKFSHIRPSSVIIQLNLITSRSRSVRWKLRVLVECWLKSFPSSPRRSKAKQNILSLSSLFLRSEHEHHNDEDWFKLPNH